MRIVRQTVWLLIIGCWLSVAVLSGIAHAKDDVGTVVAIKNKAIIDRDKRTIEAKVKDGIFFNDTVSTPEASRAKMLFIDDSILTLGKKFTTMICHEGEFYVRSRYPGIVGSVTLKAGMMLTVFDGEPLPSPVIAPDGEAERLLSETAIGHQLSIPAPPVISAVPEGVAF